MSAPSPNDRSALGLERFVVARVVKPRPACAGDVVELASLARRWLAESPFCIETHVAVRVASGSTAVAIFAALDDLTELERLGGTFGSSTWSMPKPEKRLRAAFEAVPRLASGASDHVVRLATPVPFDTERYVALELASFPPAQPADWTIRNAARRLARRLDRPVSVVSTVTGAVGTTGVMWLADSLSQVSEDVVALDQDADGPSIRDLQRMTGAAGIQRSIWRLVPLPDTSRRSASSLTERRRTPPYLC